jgi:hypothetical protein
VSNNTTYAVGSKPGLCLDNRPDAPPAGWKQPSFVHKNFHNMKIFMDKDKNVPCCRRRVWRASGQTFGLIADRVGPVI